MSTIDDEQSWKILERHEPVFDKPGAFVSCEKNLHLFIFNHSMSMGLSDTTSVISGRINESSSTQSPTISSSN